MYNILCKIQEYICYNAKSIWHPFGSVSKCNTLLTEMIGSILSINKDLLHSPNLFYYFYTVINVLKAKHQVRQKKNKIKLDKLAIDRDFVHTHTDKTI